MMTVAGSRAKEIFLQALDMSTSEEQDAFVASSCQDDAGLRARVAGLLAAHRAAGKFLGGPGPDKALPAVALLSGHWIGPYMLVKELGAGGMGVVWLAEQHVPVRRRVALKVIRPGLNTAHVIARFATERQALALMDHPNIAKVLDAGTVGELASPSDRSREPLLETESFSPSPAQIPGASSGCPYFVMELVEGPSITHYCDEHHLSIAARLKLFITVCQAVQHAHQKGVIHRDIKPSNCLVAEYDGQPVPKVIDFGVAKAIGDQTAGHMQFTVAGQLIGTPEYMSPEQTESDQSHVDTRSDIYALGVLLFELLTGTTPFSPSRRVNASLEETLKCIRETEPRAPSDCVATRDTATTVASDRDTEATRLRRAIRGDLDWIVLKCLEKDRARRYASAGSLADDIRRHLDGLPVEAHRPSRWYRVKKSLARNRLTVASSLVIVLLLVGGLLGTSLGLIRAMLAYEDKRRLLYCADMNLVMDAWRNNNQARMATLLRRHVPQGGETDLRGFEWYHLWELSQRGRTQVLALSYRPHMLALSPDGKQFAVGLFDGTVSVHEFRSWKQLGSYGTKIPGAYLRTWVAYTHDSTQLVYHRGSNVNVIDLHTKQETRFSAGGQVTCIAISSDDQYLALGTQGGKVELWNLSTKNRIWEENLTPMQFVQDISFSPQGHSLAVGGNGRPLHIWDDVRQAKTPRKLGSILTWHMRAVFSPDGRKFAYVKGRDITLWRVDNGSHIRKLGHTEDIWSYDYSPDGRRIVVATRDGALHLWDAESGAKLSTQTAHAGPASCVAFTPDGKFILSAGFDRQVCLWMASLPVEEDSLLVRLGTTTAAVTPRGQFVALAERDEQPPHKLRIWNINTREELSIDFPGQGSVRHIAVSPRGRIFAWVPGNSILVLDELGQPQNRLPKPKGSTEPITAVSVSPDEQLLLSGHRDGTITVWDVAAAAPAVSLPRQAGRIFSLKFTADGEALAVSHANRVSVYRRVGERQELAWALLKEWEHDDGDTSAVLDMQFYPRGDGLLAMGSQNGNVYLWEWKTDLKPRVFSGHTDSVQGIAFSPDGMSVVSGGSDLAVIFWDLVSGQQRLRLKQNQPLNGRGLVFSSDGQTLISADRAWRLYFWHAATKEQVMNTRW